MTKVERVEFLVAEETEQGREDEAEGAALNETLQHLETGLHVHCLQLV